MTDRELLELAAKATGIELHTVSDGEGGFTFYQMPSILYWNPLESDSDALRLAVKLGLDLNTSWDEQATAVWGLSEIKSCSEDHKDDPYAATRRAIVRAAAAIGKESK